MSILLSFTHPVPSGDDLSVQITASHPDEAAGLYQQTVAKLKDAIATAYSVPAESIPGQVESTVCVKTDAAGQAIGNAIKDQLQQAVSPGGVLNPQGDLLTQEPAKPKRTRSKAKAETTDAASTAAAAKTSFSLDARAANEKALQWARRASLVVPDWRNLQPHEVAVALGMRKPLAELSLEELNNLITLLGQAVDAAGANNPGIAAYAKTVRIIDSLQTIEEWESKKLAIADGEWAAMQAGDKALFSAAKAELEAKKTILSAVALATP